MKQEVFDALSRIRKDVLDISSEQNLLASRQAVISDRLRAVTAGLNSAIVAMRAEDELEARLRMAQEIQPPEISPIPPVPEALEPVSEYPAIPESRAAAQPADDMGGALMEEQEKSVPISPESAVPPKADNKFDLEKFIGENLMSKIGVLIILVGVAIGGKYAIANDIITPLGRIICGAALGFGFIGFGVYLKRSVENLSAMLLAVGTAVLYLVTYFAFDFYGFIGSLAAGALMVGVTAFTIWTAFWHRKELIAIYGQLCAYLVPFLVGGSGGMAIHLIAYIVVINLAIAIVSVLNGWTKAYVLSFAATWSIIAGSNAIGRAESLAGYVALICVHSATYYATLLWQKGRDARYLEPMDSIIIVADSLLCFGLGYYQSWDSAGYTNAKLLVALANLAMHAAALGYLARRDCKLGYLFYVIVACVFAIAGFTFFDCLSGNVRLLLWCLSMVSAYYIACKSQSGVMRAVSFAMAVAVFIMAVRECVFGFSGRAGAVFGLLLVAASFAGMAVICRKMHGNIAEERLWAGVAAAVAYASLLRGLSQGAAFVPCLVATVLYAALFGVLNRRALCYLGLAAQSRAIAIAAQFLAVPILLVYCGFHQDVALGKYLAYAAIAGCCWINYDGRIGSIGVYWFMIATSLLAASSYEVYHAFGAQRLALSIWWGVASVAMMYVGLAFRNKMFRIYGIALLGVTLLKLLLYDLSSLSTIAKVIVFIVLGIIMLVGTYFYQKINKDN